MHDYASLSTTNAKLNMLLHDTSEALILFANTLIDSWVCDSNASFHTTSHHNIMYNYDAVNYKKVFMII